MRRYISVYVSASKNKNIKKNVFFWILNASADFLGFYSQSKMLIYLQNRNRLPNTENKHSDQRGKESRGAGFNLEFGSNIHSLLWWRQW